MASDYIVASFSKTGLKPLGDSGTYLQRFEIYDGKDISQHPVYNQRHAADPEYGIYSFAIQCIRLRAEGSPAIALQESGSALVL